MAKKRIPQSVVKETAEYDNFMGEMSEEYVPQSNLWGPVDDLEELKKKDDWKKYWVGMPACDQPDKKPHKTVYVHFRNEEDYKAFQTLIGDKLSEKTKSIWYPKREVQDLWSQRWVENDKFDPE